MLLYLIKTTIGETIWRHLYRVAQKI